MPSLTPLLANFNANELTLLSSFGDSRSYQPGDVVIRQGDENDHLYLVAGRHGLDHPSIQKESPPAHSCHGWRWEDPGLVEVIPTDNDSSPPTL